jgi:hypothetical protein
MQPEFIGGRAFNTKTLSDTIELSGLKKQSTLHLLTFKHQKKALQCRAFF